MADARGDLLHDICQRLLTGMGWVFGVMFAVVSVAWWMFACLLYLWIVGTLAWTLLQAMTGS